MSAGATVDAANNKGRGPGRVFRSFFGSGSDEVTEGFVHWQVNFVLCFWDVEGC